MREDPTRDATIIVRVWIETHDDEVRGRVTLIPGTDEQVVSGAAAIGAAVTAAVEAYEQYQRS